MALPGKTSKMNYYSKRKARIRQHGNVVARKARETSV